MATIHSVSITCWARRIEPPTWENLVRQAASLNNTSPELLEEQTCTALLDLLSQSTSTPSPTTLAYLRHSVGLRSSTTSSSSTSKPLVRPSYLASHAFLRPNAALSTLDSTFSIVLAALDAAGDSAPTYSATSVEGVLEGVAIAASLVLAQLSAVNSSASSTRPTSSTTSIHSPTLTYIIRFLTSPPIRINPKRVEEDVVERCVRSLNTTIDALEGFTPSTSSVSNDAAFVTILRLKLISTRSVLDSRPQERVQAPVHLDEEPTTSADPDLAFLISDLMYRSTSPIAISSPTSALSRLSATLKYRVAQCSWRGGSVDNALSNAFLEILLAVTEELRVGDTKSVKWASFAYSRIPELFKQLFTKGGLGEDKIADGLQGCLENALRAFSTLIMSSDAEAMEVDDSPSSTVLNLLVVALGRQELISFDVAASLVNNVHEDDLAPAQAQPYLADQLATSDREALRDVLIDIGANYSAQRALSAAVAILNATQNVDLTTLSAICAVLVDLPQVLRVAFVHVEPCEILAPVRNFLEAFDTSLESFSDAHPIEAYGTVVLFLEVVLARFSLHSGLPRHLGSSKTFFPLWLPSASAVYPLAALDEASRAAIAGWVGGLYGEGISDELMHSTNPRVLLRVAPTILKQSLAAVQAGVIDGSTLREGLSYFLQELLSFTLPQVIRWLVGEIGRTLPGAQQTLMLDILSLFVFSESLPRTVLELVASDLSTLVGKLPSSGSPVDSIKLAKLLVPFRIPGASGSSPTTPSSTLSSTSWSTHFLTSLTHLVAPVPITPTSSPSPPIALLSPSYHRSSLSSSTLFHRFLTLSPPSTTSTTHDWSSHSRLLRLSSVLFACPASQVGTSTTRTYPFLDDVLRDELPPLLASASGPAGADLARRVGQLVVQGLVLALLREETKEEVQELVGRVVRVVELLRKRGTKENGKRKRREVEDDDEQDGEAVGGETTPVEAFVGELIKCEELVGASEEIREWKEKLEG